MFAFVLAHVHSGRGSLESHTWEGRVLLRFRGMVWYGMVEVYEGAPVQWP